MMCWGLGDTSSTLDVLPLPTIPQAGPDALGYGAGGTGSVSDFLQGIINQADAGSPSLPTGQSAAAQIQGPWTQLGAWIQQHSAMLLVGIAAAGFLLSAMKGGRR